ncbi:MAG: adenosylcobinamide-phosphate synthase CbiB [Dehalococcoidia bacterium]
MPVFEPLERQDEWPRRAADLLGGILIDAAFGDPPNSRHPVVLIGRAANLARRFAPSGARRRRVYGVGMAVAIPLALAALARQTERRWPRVLGGRSVAAVALIGFASSRRTLLARAREVADALDADDLAGARHLLGYHLVSRDTSALDASEIAAAAIESVAENLHDGVLAPWCAAAVAGAPGAWAYRAMNTLDSLWGYHEPFLEELGMGAARLDDALNLVPARLGAAAICITAPISGGDAGNAWRVWRRDAWQTLSPNAGHPMAAMAGALGVVLSKRDAYILCGDGRAATSADIRRACRIADTAAGAVATFLLLAVSAGRRR